MSKRLLPLLTLLMINLTLIAQKRSSSFIFGHSLIHHEFQVNPTPSQETSIPHWIHFLTEAAQHEYEVAGQYGFLPQHANLPPIAQWGFEFADNAWDSDNEAFGEVDFTNIIITPGNFIQWQGPNENYPMETLSPVSATETIINWCAQNEDSLNIYIYENWPDMAPYLSNDFPPNESEWENYNLYLNGDFHNWFLEYYNSVLENVPNICFKMIPTGPIISSLLNQSPFSEIPIDQLYEDDAPHGRPTIYFLAALITYMATYEEPAPLEFEVNSIIHPIVVDNYQEVVDLIWDALLDFKDEDGESLVFCGSELSNVDFSSNPFDKILIKPNPAIDIIKIEGTRTKHYLQVYNLQGQTCSTSFQLDYSDNELEIDFLEPGVYLLVGKNESNQIIYRKKFVKI